MASDFLPLWNPSCFNINKISLNPKEWKNMADRFQILSLDGGGIKGISWDAYRL